MSDVDHRPAAGSLPAGEDRWLPSGTAVQIEHWDATLERAGAHMTDTAQSPTIESTGPVDAAAVDSQAVARALAGDRDAIADIYDRYADRIHTMCVHMLGDADEAADVCAEVFLIALQRLHQLVEPAKLCSWLYAITRNEVYRRTKHRARTRPVGELDDVAALAADPSRLEELGPEATAESPAADPDVLAELVQAAAAGLDDRDRMVLELTVSGGLDGQELADALGVRLDNAYQMTHRMRERFERSAGALLVVSAGREHCSDLDGVARRWDGNFDVLWRKRFARHVERCDRCQRMKSRLPKALLAGAALSQAAQAAALAAPISAREQVLARGPSIVATYRGRAWSHDGFPRDRPRPRRFARSAAMIGAVVLVVLGMSAALDDGLRERPDGNGTPPAEPDPPATPTTATAPEPTARPPERPRTGSTAPLPAGDQDAPTPSNTDGGSTVPTVPPVDDGPPASAVKEDSGTPTDPVNGPTPATPGDGPGDGLSEGTGSRGSRTDPGYGSTGPGAGSSRQTATTEVPGWQPDRPPVIRVPPTFRGATVSSSSGVTALR